jgi:CBS domain containing-hemolysin-like protein
MVSGQLRADEVSELTGFRMPEGDYETIAGLVLERLGKIPAAGEGVDLDGWRLTVLTMDHHRIAELSVHRLAPQDSEDGEPAR